MTEPSVTAQERHAEDYVQLLDALAATLDAGGEVPCLDQSAAPAWVSDDAETAEYAAAVCRTRCTALTACQRYATAHPPTGGTWAGKPAARLTDDQRRALAEADRDDGPPSVFGDGTLVDPRRRPLFLPTDCAPVVPHGA